MLFYTNQQVGKTPVFLKTLAPKFECACLPACLPAVCVWSWTVVDIGVFVGVRAYRVCVCVCVCVCVAVWPCGRVDTCVYDSACMCVPCIAGQHQHQQTNDHHQQHQH